jgi:hypothetical protein
MTKPKKKTTTIGSIARAVAKKQGITKALSKAVVEQAFLEFYDQLCETGYARIDGFGTFNIKINCRSGVAKGRLDFRLSAKLAKHIKTLTSDPKNGPVLEYLLARDEKKHEGYEMARMVKSAKIKRWKKEAIDRERDRIAKFVAVQLGQAIDASAIPSEYLTPPRGQKVLLPDHFVSARTLVERAGGLPPAKLPDTPSPEAHSPQE